ncbi:MAG: hypothetical protein AAF329_13975 [Cyanobacteria bacterium P01_A01_bin.17]
MADPTAKLHTLPWPALAGVSLLLHASALGIGLPLMLQVDTPASRSVPIPIALVDDGATAPAPQAAPIPTEPTPQPTSGTNAAERALTQPSPPAEQPPTQQNSSPQQSEATPAEGPRIERPTESPGDVPLADTPPADQIPENQPPENQPPASEVEDAETVDGAIAISILDVATVSPDTLGDWPETMPTLQSASNLSIPGGHGCGNQLPTGAVTVGLIIEADGSVSEAFAPDPGDTVLAQVASCLLSRADGLRFTPAYSGGAAVATDRMQLTVEFYGG